MGKSFAALIRFDPKGRFKKSKKPLPFVTYLADAPFFIYKRLCNGKL
jgi:hypothetical protein